MNENEQDNNIISLFIEVAAKYVDHEKGFETTTYLEGFLSKDPWDGR